MIGVYGIFVMFMTLFLLRIPVGYTLALVGFCGITYVIGLKSAFSIIGTDLFSIFSNYGLTVIPMFILVGEFAHYGGYDKTLYFTTYKWFGHYRGGLAITTIMACAAFSAISGSNTATAATMSRVAIPEMKKYGYHPILNAGSVAAGSTLGVMIPPSLLLVIYAIFTGQSIGKLFFGNVIPSAILTILMITTVFYICHQHPDWGPKGPKSTWSEKWKALPDAIDILILFAIIMVALYTGVVTATEAAAASSAVGLIICLLRKKLTWKGFVSACIDTLRISCLVFMLVACATIFGRFLAVTRLPFVAASWISSLPLPNWMLLWAILLSFVVGGCVMDGLAFLLIALPIFYPIVDKMGYDPIWFGQVLTITVNTGAIIPPIGICCYIVAGYAKDIPIATVFKGASYFLPTYIIADIILVLSPYWTVLVLSNLVR
jgi:tripartite ATP-independent transporter DctM subunit